QNTFGLPVYIGTIFGILLLEGFVITTIDTAVRLNRYLLEELWGFIFKNPPRIFSTYIFNAFICVLLMFLLAYYNAFLVIWPIFGTANQLLAALTLIALTAWLMVKGKRYWFTLFPAIFMIVTTVYSLLHLFTMKYLPDRNWTLASTDMLLILLAAGVVIVSLSRLLRDWNNSRKA
ncbi:MAG: carbon starvation protein A, partial [Nitrospirae bacterium]|nr:carbon starvation protein A [Nitrospirota bacterium]